MKLRDPARRVRLECSELPLEDGAAAVILVAQVDVDGIDTNGPGGDDRSLEESVRVALEVVTILERTRLTLVDVDGHQARRWFGCHDLPLASGGESGAAESSQPRVLHQFNDVGRC